jgi:cytochrome b561
MVGFAGMTSRVASGPRYTRGAISLHWATAALICFNLAVGFFMEGLRADWKAIVVPLHISSGMTIFGLTLVRIVWRLSHAAPPFAADMPHWQRISAHAAHGLIYLMMIAMPLTGWSIISAHPPRPGAGPKFFGLSPIPPLAPIAALEELPQKAAHAAFVELHSIGGWLFLALLLLHVSAALKHQFLDGHLELERMGLGRPDAQGSSSGKPT